VKVRVDGQKWFEGPAVCVLVGNVGRILGGVQVFPDARCDDGVLDVGVLSAQHLTDWLRVGVRAALGRIESSPLVQITPATKVRIKLDRKMPWEVDGGARPPTKTFKVSVLPGRVPILVPVS
jgi:diacylglycerol kinase (ATP)